MSGEQRFDAIVIGAGQAGPFLGATLVARGMKVALIEERDLGGTCVNRGCTPTKTLRKAARVAHMARRASEFGVQTGSVQVNFRAAMERMQRRVEEARSGLQAWLGQLEGLTIIKARGRLAGREGEQFVVLAGEHQLVAPKVVLIVVIAFFPVTLDMLSGLQSVDPGLVALMRSVGARETDILLKVRIPHSLPHLMAGMKIAITFSVIGAIVGEFAGASAGLGYMIQFASTQLDTPLIFAALIVVSVVGVVFYYLIELLERVATPWSPKFDLAQQA